MKNEVTIWENQLAEIKKSFGVGLNDAQFNNFMQIGKALGLNPFMREIFAVNYNGVVSVFVARDGYRRNAVPNPDYDGHIVDSIYEGDTFRVVAGVPEHTYSNELRTKILGAYCICYKKSTRIPFFVKVNFGEYFRQTPIWKTKGETMIKKVAESQCLKASFPNVFKGTYSDAERWEDKSNHVDENEIIMPDKLAPAGKHVPTAEEIIPNPKSEPAKKFQPKPPIEKVQKPAAEKPVTVQKPEPDNKKYKISSPPIIDLSDILSYNAQTINPEFKPICDKIVKGWAMLKYHDVHIKKSLQKHLEVSTLNKVTSLELLNSYFQVLRGKYQIQVAEAKAGE